MSTIADQDGIGFKFVILPELFRFLHIVTMNTPFGTRLCGKPVNSENLKASHPLTQLTGGATTLSP